MASGQTLEAGEKYEVKIIPLQNIAVTHSQICLVKIPPVVKYMRKKDFFFVDFIITYENCQNLTLLVGLSSKLTHGQKHGYAVTAFHHGSSKHLTAQDIHTNSNQT